MDKIFKQIAKSVLYPVRFVTKGLEAYIYNPEYRIVNRSTLRWNLNIMWFLYHSVFVIFIPPWSSGSNLTVRSISL